jgi:hypothetical protein
VVNRIGAKIVSADPKAKTREVKFKAAYASASAGGFEPQTVVGLKANAEQNSRNKGWSVSNSLKPESLILIPEKGVKLEAGETLVLELDQRSRKKSNFSLLFAVRCTADSRVEIAAAAPAKIAKIFKQPGGAPDGTGRGTRPAIITCGITRRSPANERAEFADVRRQL